MRILFITANRLGDAVLSTGLLAWLERTHPDARFTIVCGPVASGLFRAVPRLDNLIVMRKQKWNRHWLGLWQSCIGIRWDLIIDLRNSIVSRLLPARRRAYRPAHNTGHHKVLDNASTLNLSPPPAPHIWLDAAAIAAAALISSPAGGGQEPTPGLSGLWRPSVRPDLSILALGPSANWPCKQWPIENFIQLAKRLTAPDGPLPDARILLTAAPHERDQLAPMFNAFPVEQIIDAVGQDLLTVAACFTKARLFVGNDSGLMHMASAMNIPVLGLFGPGYEAIYGPWGERTAFIRTPESTAELLKRLPHPGAHAPNLMQSLTVDNVYEAATGLIART